MVRHWWGVGSAPWMRVVLRPFVVFFGVTLMGYALLRWSSLPSADGLGSYGSWLGGLFPLDARLADAAVASLHVAVGAVVVAAVLGAALGGLLRLRPIQRPASAALLPMLSIAGPGLAIVLAYLVHDRLDLGLEPSYVSVLDDAGAGISSIVAPAVFVGLMLAPSVASMVAGNGAHRSPFGLAAAGALLAGRSESRTGWRFGAPTSLFVIGLFIAEPVFLVPGLTTMLPGALATDARAVLDIVALFVLAGLAVTIVVDLIDLRRHQPPALSAAELRLAGYDAQKPARWMLLLPGAVLAVLAVGAIVGQFGDPLAASPSDRLSRPFSDGHLLGTDELGRDLLTQAVAGLLPALAVALLSSLVGLAVGGLFFAARRWPHRNDGRQRGWPSVLVDALWWPLPLLYLIASILVIDVSSSIIRYAVLIGLFGLGLAPHGHRLLLREMAVTDRAAAARAVGAWFLLAVPALLGHITAVFSGAFLTTNPELGSLLRAAPRSLDQSWWPVLVPSAAVFLLLLALNGVGAALVHRGWHQATAEVTKSLEADTAVMPIAAPDERPQPDQTGDIKLSPNFSLQPGLAMEADIDTVTLNDWPPNPH